MMASGKNAKKSRTPAPVVTRREGLPWITIGAVSIVVLLVAGIFWVVYSKTQEKNAASDALAAWVPSESNQDPSTAIPGIYVGASTPATAEAPASYVDYKAAIHITADQRVAYNRFPPVGGPHDGTWANCNGIVYATAVRSENMVHTLEHGAVWITYNPDTISDADLTVLKGLVDNQPYTTLTPYPGLDSTVSLQAWAHQLKVDSATDERVKQFITALRQNRWVYPETGATCQQPSFDVTNPPPFDADPARCRRHPDERRRRDHGDQRAVGRRQRRIRGRHRERPGDHGRGTGQFRRAGDAGDERTLIEMTSNTTGDTAATHGRGGRRVGCGSGPGSAYAGAA